MPKPGEYLVSIGRKSKAVGTIYQIVACRRIFQKNGRPHVRRYGLVVIKVPEMRVHMTYDESAGTVNIKGVAALPMYWFPRNKKPTLL